VRATPEEQRQGLEVLDLDEQERTVMEGLLDLQLNPASIDANIFPMLSIATDLKLAIRSGLKGVHAMALSKLSAKNLGVLPEEAESIRVKATNQVCTEKLSAAQTRKLVKEIISSNLAKFPASTRQLKQVKLAAGNLKKLSPQVLEESEVEQLVELQEVLRQKLAEIEAVLKQNAIAENSK
jgi:ParB family transcriptional regulator, chromosome partitioning protein